MALSTGFSLLLALLSAVFLFSGMQMYLTWIIATPIRTIFGGYLGSLLFVFLLTAVGNFESILFGKSFQQKVFPEVLFCLFMAVMSSALIHRVCATSCLLISLAHLHFINKYSQKVYATQVPVQPVQTSKRKK